MDFIWSVIGFIIMMGLIVTIHEYGHFQVARWFNIKVTDFSVGFGKPIYQKAFSEVTFKIGAIPLGGYVKFVDEREGPVNSDELCRAFNRQSVYKRFAVVAAGPAINLLLAWIVFSGMQIIGTNTLKPLVSDQTFIALTDSTDQSNQGLNAVFNESSSKVLWELVRVDDQVVSSWQTIHRQVLLALIADKQQIEFTFEQLDSPLNQQVVKVSLQNLDVNNTEQKWLAVLGLSPATLDVDAVVGQVVESGPAYLAGLQSKDRILAFDQLEIENWQHLVEQVQASPGKEVTLTVLREGAVMVVPVKLDSVLSTQVDQAQGRLGVGVDVSEQQMQPYMNKVSMGPVDALIYGYQRSVDLIVMSLQMLQRMIMGEVSLSHLSGPISIAQFSGQAVQSGLISFLSLLGLLSLSIGFLNLLPIPVLDGGHLLYYLVEMVKGSPVSENIVLIGQQIGLFLIISLTLLALFNDVIRLSNA